MALRLFQELYYLAHSENLGSIVERGIFSHALVGHTGVQHVDISQSGAQQWRVLPEPVFGCAIHEYVPLYFNPRNPMLFVRRHQQRDLVVLRVSVNAVKAAGQALFTDGNAASRATRFSTGFGVVKAATPVLEAPYWSDFHDGRRMRCAEALVLNRVALQDPRLCQLGQLAQVPGIGDKTLEKSFAFIARQTGAVPPEPTAGPQAGFGF